MVLPGCDSGIGPGWTAIETSIFGEDEIYGVTYGGGTFVAVGAGGKTAYSN
jgi:hypothetical protein